MISVPFVADYPTPCGSYVPNVLILDWLAVTAYWTQNGWSFLIHAVYNKREQNESINVLQIFIAKRSYLGNEIFKSSRGLTILVESFPLKVTQNLKNALQFYHFHVYIY